MADGVAAALHELRRPLQIAMLSLAGPGAPPGAISCLEQAASALEQLEHVLGLRAAPATGRDGRVAAAELLAEARARWSGAGAGDAVDFRAAGRDLELGGDRRRLGAALDNLIANALEHGGGGARVDLRGDPEGVRLLVTNPVESGRDDGRDGGDGFRHGHGREVAARTAGELGGRLEPLRHVGSQVVSEMLLPVAAGGSGAPRR